MNPYPKVSNYFSKPGANQLKTSIKRNVPNVESAKHIIVAQAGHTPMNNQASKAASYTISQTYAARLRFNQAKNKVLVELTKPKYTTKQCLLVVILNKDDFMIKLANSCRFTLIGKFSITMPKVELIRKDFIVQTQLTGGVRIGHFNARHIYIDLDNGVDYITVWTKQKIYVEGQIMRI